MYIRAHMHTHTYIFAYKGSMLMDTYTIKQYT